MFDTKKKFLSSQFGKVHKIPNGRYWISPDCKTDAVDFHTLLTYDFDKPLPDCIKTIFKGKLNQRIRVMRFQANGDSYVAKIFRPYRLRNLIRNHIIHKRYTFTEMKNTFQAAKLDISVPRVYAYFEQTIFGLVRQSGIILQDIHDHTPLKELLISGKRTISDCLPVYKELFHKGVYYMDSNTKNLMLRQSDNHFTIIDWQNSIFYPKINYLQFCYMAAKMFRCAKVTPESDQGQSWLKAIHKQCGFTISFDKMLKTTQKMQGMKIHIAAKITPDMAEFK